MQLIRLNGIASALLGMILEIGGYVEMKLFRVHPHSFNRSLLRMDSDRCLCMWSDHHEIWKLDKEFLQIIADLKARQTK